MKKILSIAILSIFCVLTGCMSKQDQIERIVAEIKKTLPIPAGGDDQVTDVDFEEIK